MYLFEKELEKGKRLKTGWKRDEKSFKNRTPPPPPKNICISIILSYNIVFTNLLRAKVDTYTNTNHGRLKSYLKQYYHSISKISACWKILVPVVLMSIILIFMYLSITFNTLACINKHIPPAPQVIYIYIYIYIYMCVCVCVCVCLPNTSAQEESDTRVIFKDKFDRFEFGVFLLLKWLPYQG